VYITFVGLVYNLVLRKLWVPTGMQRVVDESLHSVITFLCVVCWIIWIPKKGLEWKDISGWLLFPAFYAGFIIFRGAFSGYYPYPFIDVGKLGYEQVLLNSGLLVLAFLFFSLLPVAIGKILPRK